MEPTFSAQRRWACPNCTTTSVTYRHEPHTEMHTCRGLRGMWAPLVDASQVERLHVVAIERDDYVNGEKGLRFDGEGRAISAVSTLRPDGSNDLVVYPGVASMDAVANDPGSD